MVENEINVDVKIKDLENTNELLRDVLKEQSKSFKEQTDSFNEQLNKQSKHYKHIIMTIIICFAVTFVSVISAFLLYENQFAVLPPTEESYTELKTEGDNANINNVEGDQYNGSSSHNEGVE